MEAGGGQADDEPCRRGHEDADSQGHREQPTGEQPLVRERPLGEGDRVRADRHEGPVPERELAVATDEDGEPGGGAEVSRDGGELVVAEGGEHEGQREEQSTDDEDEEEVSGQAGPPQPRGLEGARGGRHPGLRGGHTCLAFADENSPEGRTSRTRVRRTRTASGVMSLPR